MKRLRRSAYVVLVLVGLAFVMSSSVSAKQVAAGIAAAKQQINLNRNATDLNPNAVKSTFGRPSTSPVSPLLKEICSGSCSCSTCTCTGSFGCCLGGCIACWDHRDDQGLCGAVQ